MHQEMKQEQMKENQKYKTQHRERHIGFFKCLIIMKSKQADFHAGPADPIAAPASFVRHRVSF